MAKQEKNVMDTHRVDFTMAPVTFTDSSCTGPGWPGLSLGLLGSLGCLAVLGANGLAAMLPCHVVKIIFM